MGPPTGLRYHGTGGPLYVGRRHTGRPRCLGTATDCLAECCCWGNRELRHSEINHNHHYFDDAKCPLGRQLSTSRHLPRRAVALLPHPGGGPGVSHGTNSTMVCHVSRYHLVATTRFTSLCRHRLAAVVVSLYPRDPSRPRARRTTTRDTAIAIHAYTPALSHVVATPLAANVVYPNL